MGKFDCMGPSLKFGLCWIPVYLGFGFYCVSTYHEYQQDKVYNIFQVPLYSRIESQYLYVLFKKNVFNFLSVVMRFIPQWLKCFDSI
jgi:hypothetical protein